MARLHKDCLECDSCEEISGNIDSKIISIAEKRLYNTLYELNRPIDYPLYGLLSFYKKVVDAFCSGTDCGCYTGVFYTSAQTSVTAIDVSSDITINKCICGCCNPLQVTCTSTATDIASQVTEENIFERVKILLA